MKLKEVILFLLFLFNTPLIAQEVVFDPAVDHSNAVAFEQQSIEKEELDNKVKVKIEISNSKFPDKVGDLNHKDKKHYAIHGYSTLTISVEGDLKIVKVEMLREDSKESNEYLTSLKFDENGGKILNEKDKDKRVWLGANRSSIAFENASDVIYLSKIIVTLNTFKISKAGFATMWLDNSYIMPEGVTGYFLSIENGKLKYLYDYPARDTVKAGLPLLIEGTANTYKYDVAKYKEYIAKSNDILRASTGTKIEVAKDEDKYLYKFSYDKDGKNLGFYWDSENGKTINNVPYGKCYLMISKKDLSSSGASNVKGFSLSDIVNGIDNVIDTTPEMDTKVYDLRGVFIGYRLEGLSKGVYIQNGKKVVIK